MKNDNFFKHDASASNDERIMVLIEREGLKGYGAYWMLIEALRKQEDLYSSFSLLRSLAYRSRVHVDFLMRIVKDFGLFVVEGERFYSPGLMKRMAIYIEKGRRMSVKPNVKSKDNALIDKDDSAIHAGETEENRTEENKLTVVDVNKIDGQIPVQPYPGWEALVDEMAASQDFMCQVGVHSGMGVLYLQNQRRILQLFKDHIRLHGREERMITLGEVKSYFTNFLCCGSITNRKIRAALMKEVDGRSGQYAYRFEERVGGKRMYMGHVIPADAPPRPDASAVWDDVKKKWGH